MGLRRWRAAKQRIKYANVWPINEAAGKRPEGWPGWPNGKKFAFVLTHDVEAPKGVDNCSPLMQLEESLGFRSCFNFVPEGYTTPKELRDSMTARGFEIGIHDLKHDGKLFQSYSKFEENARRINSYMKEWGAVGFRAGFMLHRLDWMHHLNGLYDSSTFDTDPFEPQPDGAGTIFPFWINVPGCGGYVELPYTLVQDFNLFVILKEQNFDIWKKKVDWIADKGGMVLLDSHPDYMAFNGTSVGRDEYDVKVYREFLEWVKTKYESQYWHALPRDVAALAHEHRQVLGQGAEHHRKHKIWIDLDNTPHVPFFQPIIRELEKRDYKVVITARDAFQVCELASRFGLNYTKIGHHYGKNRLRKILGLLMRSFQLLPFMWKNRPTLGLSHGARSQQFLCSLFRIPTVLLMDYEHAKSPPLARSKWEIVPDSISVENCIYAHKNCVRQYTGIKEDVYAPELKPDPSILKELGIAPASIVITVRPPATEAHYHNPESEILFTNVMERIYKTDGVQAVLLPRNKKQGEVIQSASPQWFEHGKTIIPKTAVDGMNLIWHSDLVVSGGGTMNREAAALSVPVYSIFRGKIGGVDHRLEQEGRLILIKTVQDVFSKIQFKPRVRDINLNSQPRLALQQIVRHIEDILKIEYSK
jgi:uncharacterized protein